MTQISILHVDDDEKNRLIFSDHVQSQGYQVDSVSTAAGALRKLEDNSYSATVIDIHMPVMDGLSLISEIDNAGLRKSAGKFFVLTSDHEIKTKEEAFNLGITDYLTFSMKPEELFLRINSRISERARYEWRGISLDGDGLGFIYDGVLHHLTRIEYRLLTHLIKAAGGTLSRDDLRDKAWPGEVVLDQTINTHISNLRSKIRPIGFDVQALRNQGFKLVE